MPARPNPFRASTELGFILPSDSRVTLRIYDVAGRLIRTVVDSPLPAGIHRLTWDGTDSGGRAAGTGIYFAKWSAGIAGGSERLLLLKKRGEQMRETDPIVQFLIYNLLMLAPLWMLGC